MRNDFAYKNYYRPEIDGLRAFAVLAVIINHFNKDMLPGGYLGVDIFFVISGFVITSSLYQRPCKNFKDFISGFYERRIKRLVPALSVFVLITSITICLFNPQPSTSLKTGLTSLFGLSNLFLFRESTDYFGESTQLNVFTHTWSLGIEEQFYILFPFLIWFSGFGRQTKNGARNLFLTISVLAFASLIGFIYLYPINQPAAYFLMPTRFWEIASGCLLFIGLKKKKYIEKCLEKIPPLVVVVLIIGVMYLPMSLATTSTFAVVLLSLVLIASLKKGNVSYTFFTNTKVIYMGLISYSLYLWHWSVLSISRWTIGIHWWSAPIQVVLIYGFAIASYRYIETPLRKFNWFGKKWKNLICAGGILIILSSGLIALGKPLKGILYTGKRDQQRGNILQKSKRIKNCNMTPHLLSGNRFRKKQPINAAFINNCLSLDTKKQKILLVGDSFAGIQAPLIADIAKKLDLEFVSIYGFGCPYPIAFKDLKYPKSSKCKFVDEKLLINSILKNINPNDLLITRFRFSNPKYLNYKNFNYKFSNSYDLGLDKLSNMISKRLGKMLVIGSNPSLSSSELLSLNPQWFNIYQENLVQTISKTNNPQTELYLSIDKKYENIAKEKNWNYFPTRSYFCKKAICFIKKSGEPLYFDKTHLTQTGMLLYQEDLKNIILSLIN